MNQFIMKSPVGPLYLVASAKGLYGIFWKKQPVPLIKRADSVILETIRQLEEYFAGKRKVFSLPLSPCGTDFQQKVWQQLRLIPFAATNSYSEIARKIGHPKASRAVGAANGKNPLSIVVPCHRVIGADGSLTGFAGGMKIKSRLLELEQKFK